MSSSDMRKLMEAMSSTKTLNEGMDPVEVIIYNSGYGEKLADVAKQKDRKKTVTDYTMTMNSGKPVINFQGTGGSIYATYHPDFGWVADMD